MQKQSAHRLKCSTPTWLCAWVCASLCTLLLVAQSARSDPPKAGPVKVKDFPSAKTFPQPLPKIHVLPATFDGYTFDGYVIEFPGTELPSVPITNRSLLQIGQLSKDRVRLAEGAELRVAFSKPPYAVVTDHGKASKPVTFGHFLLDHALWKRTPKEINDFTYLINRGNDSPDAYELFGLARSHGKVYLGVVWYSPTESFAPRSNYALILRLDWDGKTIKPVPIRVVSGATFGTYAGKPQPPLLCSLVGDGDLILMDGKDFWRLSAGGVWQKLPTPALNWDDTYPYGFWLRGRWLLVRKTDAVGENGQRKIFMKAFDVLSGKPVREFRWTMN